MMRSLYSGVSGLQNHQTRMDVVGNNIANINTTGFKKGRANFQDMLSQQLNGAARPTTDLGGVNPKEVGLGMSIASIDTIHIQGSLQSTGKQDDLAIQGMGFFILKEGDKFLYTRAGAFGLDNEGTMVNPGNGQRVQGWMAQDIDGQQFIDVSKETEDLVIPVGSKDPARATTNVNFACNLDKRTPMFDPDAATEIQRKAGTWSTSMDIYDSLGVKHQLQVNFNRVPGSYNDWEGRITVDAGIDPVDTYATVTLGEDPPSENGTNHFIVSFANDGTLLQVEDDDGNISGGPPVADALGGIYDQVNQGALVIKAAFDVHTATPEQDGTLVRQEFTLNLGSVGAFKNSMTQYAEASSTKMNEQDGHNMGYMENFKIDQSGVITGIFSNGTTRTLGQVALASFPNQGGLEKAGDNTYRLSNNSGNANIGPSGIAGKGKIIAGTLEMSNVDMAEQFTDMIVTQRGFQANSRTIQTADQLLQELLTLKR
ncbi:flagellar hook protein FlgE [Spirochaetia bacterium]|nr:flagellar hook protein FlgE [Spirochaetia bacterium]